MNPIPFDEYPSKPCEFCKAIINQAQLCEYCPHCQNANIYAMQKSTIKCHFCDQFLWYHHPSNGHYNCHGHGEMNISYTFSGSEVKPNLWSITFIFGHPGSPWTYHHLSLAYHANKTSVYFFGNDKKLMKEEHLLFTLDHIIPNVTAQNAQQTLDKLLALKAFS